MGNQKNENTLTASKEAIEFHYDISNTFYKLWLDPSMTYSCALWGDGDNLETAQTRKLDHHIIQSGANKAKSVLDIGCGWGSTMIRLFDHYKIPSVTGLTLSKEQAEYINDFELNGIDVEVRSWEDHKPKAAYDSIISIGAFEHFARLNLTEEERVLSYRNFFRKCHEWLENDGQISLQTISCGNMLREDFSDFFANEVFPESDLPTLSDIAKGAQFLFEIVHLQNDRIHYAKTLKAWLLNLENNKDEAIKMVGAEMVKKYITYFKLSIIGFEALGSMGLYRLTLKKIEKPREW